MTNKIADQNSKEFALTIEIHKVVHRYAEENVHPIDLIRSLNVVQAYILGKTVKSQNKIEEVAQTCKDEFVRCANRAYEEENGIATAEGTIQ